MGARARSWASAAEPSREEVVAELLLFIRETVRELGEQRATGFLKKFYGWYLGRGRFPRPFKQELVTLRDARGGRARLLAAAPGAREVLERLEAELPDRWTRSCSTRCRSRSTAAAEPAAAARGFAHMSEPPACSRVTVPFAQVQHPANGRRERRYPATMSWRDTCSPRVASSLRPGGAGLARAADCAPEVVDRSAYRRLLNARSPSSPRELRAPRREPRQRHQDDTGSGERVPVSQQHGAPYRHAWRPPAGETRRS